jgi:hypothetical protein
MPLTPKPKPPKRCACKVCLGTRDRSAVRHSLMGIISVSYRREELRSLVQVARATMLPKDPA